ncbi:4-alpha-glucanotransferase [Planctomycetota bacterium]
MFKKRGSGILLHISSIPTAYGIGDVGPAAHKFVDFLKRAGQNYWQILPLNYTTAETAYSPYNGASAFAGYPLLISPDLMYRDGLLQKHELQDLPDFPPGRVDYRRVSSWKSKLFNKAFARSASLSALDDYDRFAKRNTFWLEDFATFVAVKKHFGGRPWIEWPKEIRDRRKRALTSLKEELKEAIDRESFLQYLWFKQYSSMRDTCEENAVKIVGDLPIYVAHDSADVWAHPKYFKLDPSKKPKYIAGVPPDYFSRTGQLWGNPIYNWRYLDRTDYDWWMRRIEHNLRLFDLVRIDHFRGLVAYWQVPAGEKTAVRGKWIKAPTDAFFSVLFRRFPSAPIFAEDLGYITTDVREAISEYGLACMRVLQFGFDEDNTKNLHCPHNHIENCLVYTGTHDNNTTRGWFETEATPEQKKRLSDYLGHNVSAKTVHREMIRLAMASVAKVVIIPMQDLLALGSEARMNRPAKTRGNWLWRVQKGQASAALAKDIKRMVETYGRI